MPDLHLIGDSISIAYGPHLAAALAAGWHYSRMGDETIARRNLDQAIGANGGDSARVRSYLASLPAQATWDLLVLNCGLHDLKRLPPHDAFQVGPDDYRDHLEAIVGLARSLARTMVWITTTPVDDTLHAARGCSFGRRDTDVITYNAIADAVMTAHQVPVVDLGSCTRGFGSGADIFRDGVHFHDHIAQRQGAYIAAQLLEYDLMHP